MFLKQFFLFVCQLVNHRLCTLKQTDIFLQFRKKNMVDSKGQAGQEKKKDSFNLWCLFFPSSVVVFFRSSSAILFLASLVTPLQIVLQIAWYVRLSWGLKNPNT